MGNDGTPRAGARQGEAMLLVALLTCRARQGDAVEMGLAICAGAWWGRTTRSEDLPGPTFGRSNHWRTAESQFISEHERAVREATMTVEQTLSRASPSFLRWRGGGPGRNLRIVLLGLWSVVFIIFTIRSFFLGLPHIGEQAVIRMAMMAAGILLCALFYLLARSLRGAPPVRAAAALLSALLASTLVYTILNYALIYEISGLFRLRQPFSYVIADYYASFLWIFVLWAVLCHFALGAVSNSAPSREDGRQFSAHELWVRHRNGMVRVDVDEIRWIEAEGDYVRLHLDGASYLYRSTMANMERRLADHAFARIHRRALVRQREITRLVVKGRRRFALLGDALEIPIGHSYVAGLLKGHASRWR